MTGAKLAIVLLAFSTLVLNVQTRPLPNLQWRGFQQWLGKEKSSKEGEGAFACIEHVTIS
jgi:hypothetical protein